MNLVPGAAIGQPQAETAGIRPEHLLIAAEGWSARALVVETLGADTIVHADVEKVGHMTVRLPGNNRLRAGEVIHIAPEPGHLHLFDKNGQRMEEPA